ncbi:hypothetical protein FW320_13110 [Azospirillum sp. Vi22]|uniref:hypothetical protein n=1 Tax=Azospirillum baldaniorum TaxID=1064539 RepID=UPI00157A9C2D|nr:hypothetical protein [Azospirillum baldaniorum]NUB07110.1 hypothetical protein [Azospirillum baldaniorum]
MTTDTAPLSADDLDRIRKCFVAYDGPDTPENRLGALNHVAFLGERSVSVVPHLLNTIDALSARVESLENSRSCAIADHVAAEARAIQAVTERDALKAELSRLRDEADRQTDEMTDRWHADQAALAETRARETGLREALEPFLAAAAGMAEIDMPDDAAVLRASADWWLRSGEAGKKGRPLTFGDFRKLAALFPQPASEALPRKLALSLYETWTFVLLWAVGQAQARGGKMHRVHAAILARLHDAMTSAATAGILLGDSTARLPGLLAEHGYDLEDLLRETAPVETKEPSHG